MLLAVGVRHSTSDNLSLALQIQQLQDEKEDLQEEMEAAQKECAAERANSAALRRQVG